MLTGATVDPAVPRLRERGAVMEVDGRIRGAKKETDGKEKESCCIRKLFISCVEWRTQEKMQMLVWWGLLWPPCCRLHNHKFKVCIFQTERSFFHQRSASSTSMQQRTFKTYSVTPIYNAGITTATCTFQVQEEASSSGGNT